jgi:hypothetical protein
MQHLLQSAFTHRENLCIPHASQNIQLLSLQAALTSAEACVSCEVRNESLYIIEKKFSI